MYYSLHLFTALVYCQMCVYQVIKRLNKNFYLVFMIGSIVALTIILVYNYAILQY